MNTRGLNNARIKVKVRGRSRYRNAGVKIRAGPMGEALEGWGVLKGTDVTIEGWGGDRKGTEKDGNAGVLARANTWWGEERGRWLVARRRGKKGTGAGWWRGRLGSFS